MGANAMCHLEIGVKNAKKASEFYKDVFGWKLNNDMGDEYIFFIPESGPSGAFSTTEKVNPSTTTICYFDVDDIPTYIQKAVSKGGKEIKGKTEIPGHGWYGLFADPDGNVIGLFTKK